MAVYLLADLVVLIYSRTRRSYISNLQARYLEHIGMKNLRMKQSG